MSQPSRRDFVRDTTLVAATLAIDPLQPPLQADDTKTIWGKEILSQPMESATFREIKIPDWVQETMGAGYTLSVMGSKDRKEAAEMGVTLSEVGFVDPFYAYYDSKLLKKRSPHVPLEKLQKELVEYQKLGVRVLGVYPPTLQGEVWENHPDWRRIATDTDKIPEVDLKAHPYGGMLCLLGPYGDFFIDVLCEIVEKYPVVKAFSFDGFHHGGGCYCQHCRTNFKKDTGRTIPKRDLQDQRFREYLHWADRRLEGLVQRMQTRLKKINPEVALVTWTTNAGRFGHFLDIPRNMPSRLNLLFDAPDQELWMDETNRGSSIVPAFGSAYIWATTNHRVAFSEPYFMSRGNPYGKDSFPTHEIERRALMILTHGSLPSLAIAQPEPMKLGIRKAMESIRKRKKWLTHKRPESWCALLMSDNTRVFYGKSGGEVEERYLANVLGFFRATQEMHLPTTIINDWNLNEQDLSKFAVLVLPNTACLDPKQAKAVETFVKNGGGLIASLDVGICDSSGTLRERSILEELLGVVHRGVISDDKTAPKLDENFARTLPPDYWKKRQGIWDFRRSRLGDEFWKGDTLDKLIGKEWVTFKGALIKIGLKEGTKVLATVRSKEQPQKPEIPAITFNEVGKGKVVYLASGVDASYYLASYPYYRLLLTESIRAVAAKVPPVEITAPMCVQSNVFRQTNNGERLVVHLFNDISTTAGHGHPSEEVPLREETIPIHDIKLLVRNQRVKNVHLEPEGIELKTHVNAGGVEVTVPKLEVHSLVVVELES